MKQQIQLSLDSEIIRRLRAKDANISELVNHLLSFVVQQETLTAEEITMAMIQEERQTLVDSLRRLEASMERTRQLIAQVDEKVKKQERVIQEVRKSERIAALMRKLNDAIVVANYDVESLNVTDILESLKAEGVPVSEAWLKRHIARIELLGK